MDWLGFIATYGWLFCFLGMAQQGKDLTFKEKFNLACNLFLWHQRGIVITCRDRWGADALGIPCFCAFILMCLWYVATQDPFMLCWIFFWTVCQVRRKWEARKLRGKVHTHYDGRPMGLIRLFGSDGFIKKVMEPLMIGAIGLGLFKLYQYYGWSPTGLPYFLLAGVLTLPFVETVNQTIWQRRLDAMANARMENEALLRDFRDNYS